MNEAENNLMAAVERAEKFDAMTISVALIEMHRKNENGGLTQSDMEVFTKRLNDLADSIESFESIGE